jgi:putative oxidoreductase
MPLTRAQLVTSWILQLTAAVILFQTLFFKFTAAEESVYIFTKVGAEPWGRIGSGVMELVAVILLLVPSTSWLGALISLAAVSGAIVSHLTTLGIVVKDDGGVLFALALVVFAASLGILYIRRHEVPWLGAHLAGVGHGAVR